MIPEKKQPAVDRALHAAFGTTTIDHIRAVTGGLSGALIYRLVVRGTPYLLRVITREAEWQSPKNEFASMQKAADAGIAPRIWYSSVEDRLLISDFIEAQPFPDDLAMRIAPVLRTLHALPDFPSARMGLYLDFVDRCIEQFRAAQFLPRQRTDECLDLYARVTAVYPRHDDLVASHNDIKPDNVLFDGRRVWLVDWEAAFLNDRFVDLAIVANFFVKGEAEEQAYLHAYFDEPPSAYVTARFYLMRQTMHAAYLAFLLPMAWKDGARFDAGAAAPDFDGFHRRLVAGEISLGTTEGKWQYALAHLDRGLAEMRAPRFEEALAIIARGK